MTICFYIFSLITIISTICVIFQKNPIYSLLYLIISFLSISGIYFSVGLFFIGAIETIIYAGAIMVLFVFVIMMLNLENKNFYKEKQFISFCTIFPFFLSIFFIIYILYRKYILDHKSIFINFIDTNIIGKYLFYDNIFFLEIISMILLASLIVIVHLCINRKNIKID
ncbi:NADH-quinone oxidoreductase subunit J [Buchnera aphidicola]|uniref:NADH-quinone oxidoreductase subunit J n=1 Tax=Buchnera aphidicola TaxID=9 RepID=UPI0022375B48|nr:NADH-quinone oxidoreductase subunit J [Buchnera aphidicola]MCW5197656.1 NADH-quinone oxidoreductase subunit J [Buchnera aphidicola (Chaitophorus viminalis)]